VSKFSKERGKRMEKLEATQERAVILSAYVPPGLKAGLLRCARDSDRSLSAALREAVRAYCTAYLGEDVSLPNGEPLP
jgi:hypothetical protein